MAWRAVRALGLPCRLVKAQEIAEGPFLRKPSAGGGQSASSLLLVPGGNARLKARALGAKGRQVVRRWLAQGGQYLGFCGGAGLALTQAHPEDGLHICPWGRAPYAQRLYHLISGHVLARVAVGQDMAPPGMPSADPFSTGRHGARVPLSREDSRSAEGLWSLPVWWPGQFAPLACDDVTVLAACHRPEADFWLADLPLCSLPEGTLAAWRALYGIHLSTDFLEGRPLVVCGRHGRGRYVLSYTHLETPGSADANAWLAHLLNLLTGLRAQGRLVPLWHLRRPSVVGGHPCDRLETAWRHMRGLLDLAVAQHLFFARTHWLWGWRTGMPGAGCNNLHAALCTALTLEPTPTALAYWRSVETRFATLEDIFTAGAEDFFLTCRLAETLSPTLPDVVDRRWLDAQRQALFGHPMYGGGILAELLDMVEEYIYRSQDGYQLSRDGAGAW